jgi:hypothetical protein
MFSFRVMPLALSGLYEKNLMAMTSFYPVHRNWVAKVPIEVAGVREGAAAAATKIERPARQGCRLKVAGGLAASNLQAAT